MTIPVIAVERDDKGVKKALRALFEEAFQRRCIDTAVLRADRETRARAIDGMTARKLSPGYYERAAYLLDLANSMEAGVHYSAAELSHADVRGLQMVRSARSEYEHDHPACSNCGERQDSRFAPRCRSCRCEFRRGEG